MLSQVPQLIAHLLLNHRLLTTSPPATRLHFPNQTTLPYTADFLDSYRRLPMDQHLQEGALLYFSNSKQWNFGRFLHHLDTLPSFPKDKKSRHELGTELWRSLLLGYAGDGSHTENRLKALQELAVSPHSPPSPPH